MLTKKKQPRAAGRAVRSTQPRVEKRSVEEIWKDTMRRARGEAMPYSSRASYEVGARVSHVTFGEGVVSRLPRTTVCEVILASGPVKLLMRDSRGI